MIFAAVILQEAPHGMKRAKDINALIEARLELWRQGRFATLIEDLEVETRRRDGSTRTKDEEQIFRAYNARVKSGRLPSACRKPHQLGWRGRQAPG